MSSDVVTPLIAALVASLVTILGSLAVTSLQADRADKREQARQAHEREEARSAYKRSLQDGQRERLRGDYAAMLNAADNFLWASMQLTALWAGDTPEARDERIERILTEATKDLALAGVRVRLEEGTTAIVDSFKRVRGLWFNFPYQAAEGDQKRDHSEAAATLRSLQLEVERIEATARSHLDRLSRPI